MRVLTRRAILCLVLGCVVTYAVAWGLALWTTHPRSGKQFFTHADGDRWHAVVVDLGSVIWISRVPDNGTWIVWPGTPVSNEDIPEWSAASIRPTSAELENPLLPAHLEFVSGWPMRSNYAHAWNVTKPRGSTPGQFGPFRADAGIIFSDVAPSQPTTVKVLPTRPLLPGMLINTLLYAALLFAVFFGPGIVRRAIRFQRGRCRQCGYDVQRIFEAGCPECGWNRESATAVQATAE